MANEIVQVTADKIATLTGYQASEIAVVKATVAKGTTDVELAYFLSVCKTNELNPFMREIWCFKDNKGNLLVFAGRDGFLKRAQQSSLWNGITSFEVCANDEFSMTVENGQTKIKHTPKFGNRGKILGAYAIVQPKGCALQTIEWADFETYNKGINVWKSDPATMIKKCAEIHALKKGYGITVIQSEHDFDIRNNVAVPVSFEEETPEKVAERKIIDALDVYQGEDADQIRAMCAEKKKAGEFTVEFAKHVGEQIGLAL
jgi:recombination protein RecT